MAKPSQTTSPTDAARAASSSAAATQAPPVSARAPPAMPAAPSASKSAASVHCVPSSRGRERRAGRWAGSRRRSTHGAHRNLRPQGSHHSAVSRAWLM